MLIRDFFSISLPAAFLDFWVNLGGGKDLRMQKARRLKQENEYPDLTPVSVSYEKCKDTEVRESVPKHDPFICLIYKMQKDWTKNEFPPHANNSVSPWWGGIHVGTCHRTIHL